MHSLITNLCHVILIKFFIFGLDDKVIYYGAVSVSVFIELLINPKCNSKQITIQLNTLQ